MHYEALQKEKDTLMYRGPEGLVSGSIRFFVNRSQSAKAGQYKSGSGSQNCSTADGLWGSYAAAAQKNDARFGPDTHLDLLSTQLTHTTTERDPSPALIFYSVIS